MILLLLTTSSSYILRQYEGDMKKLLDELAIFGGKPIFSEKLHVGQPNIGHRENLYKLLGDMLDRRWLTNDGPYVRELEQRLAACLGVKHMLLICNGTVALEIACRALDLHGEVIVPSFTFIATAHALQWQGIAPVFCDIGKDSHHIDPSGIEKHITARTTGIIGVHVWGHPCDTQAIEKIGRKFNLRVLYDAAHAFGCSLGGKMIGNFGDAEVFSFHATKFYHTFEGGAIATNNDETAEKIRYMRNFGFATYDQVRCIGINGKMAEISAAMGLTLLEKLEEVIETNLQHYKSYQQEFSALDGVKVFRYNASERNNYQYIVLEVDEEKTGINRDTIVKILHAENILVRRYFYPGCHEMEPYRSYYPAAGLLLPNTNKLTRRVMALPTGTAVSGDAVTKICSLVGLIISNGRQIAAKLTT